MADGSLRKRGDKWYYSFEAGKANGKRRRIERCGGSTKAEAAAAMREALRQFENGGVKVNLNNMSVHDYFEYWYENYVVKNLKKNTQLNYLNVINKYIDPAIGKYLLRTIGPAALQKMMNDLGETSLAKHSVEIILTVVRKGFKMAVFPYQLIKENPGNYIEMPKYAMQTEKTRSDLRIITMDQYQQILDMTPFSDPFNVPLQIAFGTGMRRGEVCGLEWDAIDLENHTIDVHQAMLQFSQRKKREGKNKEKAETNGSPYIPLPITGEHSRAKKKDWGKFVLGPLKTAASYRKLLIGESLVSLLKRRRN